MQDLTPKSPKRCFYDIHCHMMNLSHPNILAFLGRVDLRLAILAGSFIGPLVTLFAGERIKKILNLLAVMENDAANLFLLLEYSLKAWETADGRPPPIRDGKLILGGTPYDRLVLTPLMMDFGCKNIRAGSFYRIPPQKPIIEQVVDLFGGIAKYTHFELLESSPGRHEIVERKSPPLFEIYPFLGINTKNYTAAEVETLLQKYFSEYSGRPADLQTRFGAFDGDIDAMRSHWFAGIKVYPPLGFDPWPAEAPDPDEPAKVRLLYRCCTEKRIPLTAHCSDRGFFVDPNGMQFTSPDRWRPVLEEFPALKLNLAHLGTQQNRKFGIFPRRGWQKRVFELIAAHENVYTDISCCAFEDGFYESLRKLLDGQPPRTKERLLFGSDFMVNLLWSDSYNDYLTHFGDTAHIPDADRDLFCRENPERFLFH